MDRSDVARFQSKVDASDGPDGCHWWTAAVRHKSRGYGVFWMDGSMHFAHRVAWTIATGEVLPPSVYLRHMCDQPRCVNPRHLAPGSAADNMHDRITHGKGYPRGETHPNARLSEWDVAKAREFRAQGVHWREIARRIGVSQSTIERAVRGVTWSHLRDGTVKGDHEE